MVRAAFVVALAIAAPVAAQDSDPVPLRKAVPMVPRDRPSPAGAERVKAVDIPQSAKAEGHNGTAIYTATVSADGKLMALDLKESSMSAAIDAAARARAEQMSYWSATDKAGNPVAGTVEVRLAYARHDSDSPGGGIETYTCGDLIREYDWFTAANAARRKLFWPQNAFTSLASMMRAEQGVMLNRPQMLADRKAREAGWGKLIKRCRKAPDRLMLSEVDQPDAYARLVNSF